MAEITVSNVTSPVHEPEPIRIDWLNEQTPVVSSRDVAKHFGRKHKNVLREIGQLRANLPESFTGLNFEPSSYMDGTGRSLPAYNLTRDGFSLLVMGFTGPAALAWKVRYIQAFNALENTAREHLIELAREAAFREYVDKMALDTAEALRDTYADGIRAVLSLTPAQRAIVGEALRYRDMGLSIREISRLLGVSRDTISAALRKVAA